MQEAPPIRSRVAFRVVRVSATPGWGIVLTAYAEGRDQTVPRADESLQAVSRGTSARDRVVPHRGRPPGI
jgi:hypothetical protein